MSEIDPRLNVFRADLADARLRGKVKAERFVEGRAAVLAAPVADMRGAPRGDAGVNSQLVRGQAARVFEERDGWAWVQADRDGYTGYVPAGTLAEPGPAPTHVVTAPRSFLYPGPDLKFPIVDPLSMGALVTVAGEAETRGTRYALLAGGEAVIAGHLRPVNEAEDDYVAVAERLLFTPYLWGGTSGFGLDCSGIVQLAMRLAGKAVLRDSDMQARSIGREIGEDETPRRGDLVFWKGHVAIMKDAENIIHASGYAMMVTVEPLAEAVERIAPSYGMPTVRRRPQAATIPQ